MSTKVKFVASKYGNYQDHYYTNTYGLLIAKLEENVLFEAVGLNLGITDGVTLMNTYRGDFTKVNCGIVEHDIYGKHVYKIIKKEFIRRDMWRITMVKDMVSSTYGDLENSTLLVNRLGIDRNTFTPLLYNQENMTLSQVKTGQIDIPQLYSESGEAKPYGFLLFWAKDSLRGIDKDNEGYIGWELKNNMQMKYDYAFADITTIPLFNKITRDFTRPGIRGGSKVTIYVTYMRSNVVREDYYRKYTYWTYNNSLTDEFNAEFDYSAFVDATLYPVDLEEIKSGMARIITNKLNEFSLPYTPDYRRYDGKVVYDVATNKYYNAKIVRASGSYNDTVFETEGYDIALPDIDKEYVEKSSTGLDKRDNAPIDYNLKYSGYKYELEEIIGVPIQDFRLGVYRNCIDQPYQLTYVPMIENGSIYDNDSNELTKFNKEYTMTMLYELIRNYGGDNGKLLDIQLTPYAPITGYTRMWTGIDDELYINTNREQELQPVDVFKIKDVDEEVICMIPMYEVTYADYTETLGIEHDNLFKIDDDVDYKLLQQNRYVLTSPSGGTQHDVSVSKNDGLDYIILNMSVRPYASIYQLQPIYKGLYGENFRDTRGLIWKEESSLTFVTSAWETYKRQNVNFLNSFNADQDYKRSVTALNHEANIGNYKFDASKRMLEAGIDALQIGVKGSIATGSPIAGGVMAAASIGASVVGEAVEYGQMMYNHKMENKMVENDISYAKTQFNYAMGNIQALPENLEKVSGINIYNNMVPYIQVFEPPYIEKEMYTNYLNVNGVAVNQVVDIKEYNFNYIQGSVLIYDGTITNEEYVELQSQLKYGVRKYEV